MTRWLLILAVLIPVSCATIETACDLESTESCSEAKWQVVDDAFWFLDFILSWGDDDATATLDDEASSEGAAGSAG